MNLIQAKHISKTYGEKELFHDISFAIDKGDKVALVSANGKGKSTLLNILTGKETPDEGYITTHNDLRWAALSQNPEFEDHHTVLESIYSGNSNLTNTIKAYHEALFLVEKEDSNLHRQELQNCMEKMEKEHAWDYERRMQEMLNKLGITNLSAEIGTLSGGQKKKIALAKTLLQEVDLLILDEPTNHLDVSLIEWLENYLSRQNLSILLVTHDRYFLDNVCNSIIELADDGIHTYHGDFDYFLTKRQERIEQKMAEIERAQNKYRREIEWIRRSPKARTSKSKKRIEQFEQIEEVAKQRIEKDQPADFQVSAGRLGKKILEIKNISKSYDDHVLIHDFSYVFKKNERIGIVGPNGVGKSTLLNIITGSITPDNGNVVKGETVQFGYYTQGGMSFRDDERLIDIALEVASVVNFGKHTMGVSQFLSHFGFPHTTQYNYFANLSGGEKRRFYLMITLLRNPNFLILDEPTNDLDVYTLNVLENFLETYPGCILMVSHDRRFLDSLSDHVFAFRGNGEIKDFPGNYSQYEVWEKEQQAALRRAENQKKKAARENEKKPQKSKVKVSYKERKEFEQLETDLQQLDTQKKEILEQLNTERDNVKLTELSNKYQEIIDLLEEKEMRWLELSEKIDSAS